MVCFRELIQGCPMVCLFRSGHIISVLPYGLRVYEKLRHIFGLEGIADSLVPNFAIWG